MDFLLFIAAFVALACLGVPLVTLAIFAVLNRRAPREGGGVFGRWLRGRREPDRFLGHNGVR